jgi:hypothetical protein
MAAPKADRKATSAKPKTKRKTTSAKSKAKTKTEGRTAKGTFAKGEYEGGPGRNTIYTDELGERIAELLADGLTVNEIERMEGMPSGRSIRTWGLRAEHPFYPLYTRGREIGYHKMADDCVDIMDDGRNDWMARQQANEPDDEPSKTAWQFNGEHVSRSRLRFEGRKWLLAKALPKIYGDKLALTDPDGGALTVRFAT